MKRFVFLLALAGVSMGADSSKTFLGTVRGCEPAGATAAKQCTVITGPKYTLQTETEALVLTDEKLAAKYLDRKVTITGTVYDGNKLRVISIAPAK
jgi:hypothetical protein